MRLPKKGQDLASLYPEVVGEWDFELNDLGPNCYFPHSNMAVNWICRNKHRWTARINNRTIHSTQCPYCFGAKPIPGVNDLGTLYPHLAKEWDDAKNDKKPDEYLPKSNQRVGWVCKHGHHWESKIYHRADGRGCPYCAGQRPVLGETDFETVCPEIAKEWHQKKNGGRQPKDYTAYSHHVAMWICSEGHMYSAPIYRRVRGCGCPVCDGKKVVPGINDFASRAPCMAEEWNYARNKLTPQMIPLHYNKRVWWHCRECGHEWFTSPNNRINGNTGCPACSRCTVDPDVNSVAVINPFLAQQWYDEKNTPLTARDVAAFDNRNYYWRCDYGHTWQASPANRSKGTQCPYCTGKRPIVGENDLGTVLPQLAMEWHPTKNGDLLPEHYLPNSHEEVWWQCKEGHEWQKKIYERAHGSTCPFCARRKTTVRRNI